MKRREFLEKSAISSAAFASILSYSGTISAEAISTNIRVEPTDNSVVKDSGELDKLSLVIDELSFQYNNLEPSNDNIKVETQLSVGASGDNTTDEVVELGRDSLLLDSSSIDTTDIISQTDISRDYNLLKEFNEFSPSVPDGEIFTVTFTVYAYIEISNIVDYQNIDTSSSVDDSVTLDIENPS